MTDATTGVPFTLDGKAVTAEPGELLIDACDRHGVSIPRFCYHPRMEPVGMCRMCLVTVDTGRGPGLQPSCMIPVSPDMTVETETEAATKAQDGVLELLLINHPLDCPVCDKGGECPLQDNAYSYGPGESRFVEEKRHYEKPIPISDLVNLDRERCILCDRCTRFAADVAGDPLIHFIGRGAQTEVNTFPNHPFASYFSGNTVQICPVGALTAEPYRFKARPWDLVETESTSTVDSSGSRVVLQASRDRLVRVLGVDSDAVNWSWLSDRERFAYEATDSADRLLTPMVRHNDKLQPVRWSEALASAAKALQSDPARIGVIGGARLPLEAQHAWRELLSELGVEAVDPQLGDGLDPGFVSSLPRTTIGEGLAPGTTVVVLGVDLKEELPSLFLRVRHAVIRDGATLVELTPKRTALSSLASLSVNPLPGTAAEVVAAALAGATNSSVGGVEGAALADLAQALEADGPLTVIVGRSNLAEASVFTEAAAAAILVGRPEAKAIPVIPRGNIFGALSVGLSGGDTGEILAAGAAGDLDALILLGADPISDFPHAELAQRALDRVPTVVAVDTLTNPSVETASVVLAAAAPGEVDGVFVNLEGRLSPLRALVTASGQSRADWEIVSELAQAAGHEMQMETLDSIRDDLAQSVAAFSEIDWTEVQQAGDGPLLRAETASMAPVTVSSPSVDGYGLRLVIDRKMWDNGAALAASESLSNLAGTTALTVAPSELARLGISAGDEVTVAANGTDYSLALFADASVPKGVAHLAHNLHGFRAFDLLRGGDVADVRVATN